MTRRAKVAPGIRCKHCQQGIRRTRIGDGLAPWVHDTTDNIWCATNLTGLTARFAEQG